MTSANQWGEAPSTNIPGIKFASLPPGNYTLVVQGNMGNFTASKNAYFQFSDGTNSATEQSIWQNSAGSIGASGIEQTITYSTSQSNVTLRLQAKTDSGGTAFLNGTTAQWATISVYHYPTQSQQAYKPDQTPGNYGATSTQSATTTATGGFAAVTGSVSGSLTSSSTPRNITCSASGSYLGIDCTVPKAGNYHVCVYGTAVDGAGTTHHLELVDGSGTVIAGPTTQYMATASGDVPLSLCGNYTASSTSVTFQIYAYVSGGTETITPKSWSVVDLDAPMSMPYLTGSVTSNTTGQLHHEYAVVGTSCTSTPCTITSQSGSWLTSISRSAAGTYALNFASGEFSAAPGCSVTAIGSTRYPEVTVGTSSALTFYLINSSGSAADSAFSILCTGPR